MKLISNVDNGYIFGSVFQGLSLRSCSLKYYTFPHLKDDLVTLLKSKRELHDSMIIPELSHSSQLQCQLCICER